MPEQKLRMEVQKSDSIEKAKSPKACVEMLSDDFKRIKIQYIDKGNFAEALNDLQNSMFVADYDRFKPKINGVVKMGIVFITELDCLMKAFDQGDKGSIEFHSRKLLVTIRQMELRESCLRQDKVS
jgi:hypothetical protein